MRSVRMALPAAPLMILCAMACAAEAVFATIKGPAAFPHIANFAEACPVVASSLVATTSVAIKVSSSVLTESVVLKARSVAAFVARMTYTARIPKRNFAHRALQAK
jgi:hypothetical protein